jgi:uncharacterized protein YjbI with pentapeptide repeats
VLLRSAPTALQRLQVTTLQEGQERRRKNSSPPSEIHSVPHCFVLLRSVSFCFVLLRSASFCFLSASFSLETSLLTTTCQRGQRTLYSYRPAATHSAFFCFALLRSAPLCFALLRSAPLYFALLHFASLCSALLHSASLCSTLLRSAPLCSTLLRSAQFCLESLSVWLQLINVNVNVKWY